MERPGARIGTQKWQYLTRLGGNCDGTKRHIFVDCTKILHGEHNFLMGSLLAALVLHTKEKHSNTFFSLA